jgi:large subunit ribosomal protein L31e
MAKKQQDVGPVLERVYNVPLRREYLKVPRWRRSKKAVKALRQFLGKHMKSDRIKLSTTLNEHVWKHGGKNPPHHVKVAVAKDKEGIVQAELFGVQEKTVKGKAEVKKEKKVEKKEDKKTVEEKSDAVHEDKKGKETSKVEEKPIEEQNEESKVEVKEEKKVEPVQEKEPAKAEEKKREQPVENK